MQDSACEFCGMCEAVCPTDALLARDPVPTARATDARAANTLCGYCGVGCRLDLVVVGTRIVGAAPDWSAAANHGLLCVKGRFGWPYVHHRDRLTRPRVRRALLDGRGREWVDTDWETALDLVARTLVGVARRHGPAALGFLASAKCTNEENYLIQKLARQAFGTNNVDHCARLCHALTVVALTDALGSGAMTNSMDDIVADARAVFVIGSNTTEQHPVFGMRLRAAARQRGLPIIVADPRRIPLVDVATLHLRLQPGTDIALLNAIAHVLVANGWVDAEFIARHTEGFAALRESVGDTTPEWAAGVTGVPAADIRRAPPVSPAVGHCPGASTTSSPGRRPSRTSLQPAASTTPSRAASKWMRPAFTTSAPVASGRRTTAASGSAIAPRRVAGLMAASTCSPRIRRDGRSANAMSIANCSVTRSPSRCIRATRPRNTRPGRERSVRSARSPTTNPAVSCAST
jgi:predicted molibdopterin-dependent oxidoreductase YjgC